MYNAGMKVSFKTTVLPLITALIWGVAFAAQDVCADKVHAFTLNALRFFIAVVFLFIVRMLIRAFGNRGNKRDIARISDADKSHAHRTLIRAGLLCGLALGIASNLQQAGMQAGTDAGKAGFITALYIVLVPIFGLFLKKRAPRILWIGVALAVIGLYLLCIHSSITLASGDMLTLICAAVFAIQILLVDRYASQLDPILFCIAEFVVAGTISALGMLVFENPDWGAVASCILPILYIAVFSSGVAYLFQIIAQREGDPAVVSLLFSMESVFSVIAGAILLGQSMTAREYIGCALILVAVIIAQLPEKKASA